MSAQLSKGTGGSIPPADHGHRQWPGDREVGIVIRNPKIGSRIMRSVDAVAHVGFLAEHLEAVQEARRDVQVGEGLVVQSERLVFAESGRATANVDHDVQDRAARASHQFRFPRATSTMHAADDTTMRPGLRVLQENARVYAVRCPDLKVEGAGEETALIMKRRRYELSYASEPCCDNLHDSIVHSRISRKVARSC